MHCDWSRTRRMVKLRGHKRRLLDVTWQHPWTYIDCGERLAIRGFRYLHSWSRIVSEFRKYGSETPLNYDASSCLPAAHVQVEFEGWVWTHPISLAITSMLGITSAAGASTRQDRPPSSVRSGPLHGVLGVCRDVPRGSRGK